MRIVVLEDDIARVDWLDHTLVGTGVKPEWCQTVAELRAALADPKDVALVILDHDLGSYVRSEDEHGETGLDAARWMPSDLNAIPVLIWSVNPDGAKAMRHALCSRRFVARVVPFMSSNKSTLREIILGIVA